MRGRFLRVWSAAKNTKSPWRDVPIRDDLFPFFQIWRKEDQQIGAEHLIHYRGKPVNSVKTAWKGALRRAGITRRIRPYDLRHAFATETLAAGADIGSVADIMNHADKTMILRVYQHALERQKKTTVEARPPLSSMTRLYDQNSE